MWYLSWLHFIWQDSLNRFLYHYLVCIPITPLYINSVSYDFFSFDNIFNELWFGFTKRIEWTKPFPSMPLVSVWFLRCCVLPCTYIAHKVVSINLSLHINLSTPDLEVIKLFSCSIQLSTKFILQINVKMPTIVGILTFISRINTTSYNLKTQKNQCFSAF